MALRRDASEISDEARALHAAAPAVDLHADTLMWSRWVGYDLLARHEAMLPRHAFAGHVDVPRLREGGIGAQYFGLVSLPVSRAGNRAVIDAQIDELERAVARSAAAGTAAPRLVQADDLAAVQRANATGAVAALMGIEGAHALDGDLDAIEHFARRGVRYLGILHFSSNEAGFPAYGWGRRDDEGLTAFGRELVRRAEDAGVVLDLAHINRKGWFDVCRLARRPLYCTHTGVAGAFRHWRNADDEQLRALAATGGAAGVIFAPNFLGGDGLEPVVRHLRHMIDVGGEDLPALGSDWDGMIVPTRGLHDASCLPALTTALLRAGMEPRIVRKILRDNALRVLGEAAPRSSAAPR
jgi:membrane dipeptidase